MSDAPITTCVACGGEVYRVISPSGLSFKGEGWYITDYARKGKDSDSKANFKKETTAPSTTPSTTSAEKKETTPSPSPEKTSEKKDPPKDK